MSKLNSAVNRYFELRQQIFGHVGYVEGWRYLPIDDSRDMWWWVDPDEREVLKYSPKKKALQYWLEEHDDEYGEFGDCLYSNEIYTQRHLDKWVYRGTEFVMVVVDTHCDGNQWLQLLRADREIKS